MQPISLTKPMTPELARAVYAVLVAGCDAPADEPEDFVRCFATGQRAAASLSGEIVWNFKGFLGSGGKLYASEKEMYVTCYPEDRTPERVAAIERTMRGLAVLMGESK